MGGRIRNKWITKRDYDRPVPHLFGHPLKSFTRNHHGSGCCSCRHDGSMDFFILTHFLHYLSPRFHGHFFLSRVLFLLA